MNALDERAKAGAKGTIPVVVLPTIHGNGWEQLEQSRYEIRDTVVKSSSIKLGRDGNVDLPNGDFKLTPFAATGFAWCSNTEDRKCLELDAADKITSGFEALGDKEWLIRSTEEGNIVAITSPNYVPLPNYAIVDGLAKIKNEITIRDFRISPWETSINLRFNKDIKVAGEKYFTGTKINNGEHGKSAFEALGRMERLICDNGATMTWGQIVDVYKKHTQGGEWESFDIIKAVRDIANNAMATNGFFEHLESLTLNEKKKTDVLKRISVEAALGPNQFKALGTSYNMQRALAPNRKSETMYDIFNAVTGLKDLFPKSIFKWEEMGGKILQGPDQYMREAIALSADGS